MSTTAAHGRLETRIEADPALPTIVITREFNASRDRVFTAYTDPDLLVRWLGPRRLTMRIDEYDARSGGAYRYVHLEDDGTEYGFRGVFHEVRPQERIVQTFAYDGFPDSVSLEKAVFEDLGGRTRVTTTSVMESVEARDAIIKSGMQDGVRQGYERLDELLAGREDVESNHSTGSAEELRTDGKGLNP
ncbi:SRPBCC family protein [Streptomyces sp. NPDC002962]|uniref:SRPBCC family protein n=1 Tax=Streptomyces sp. NPDC002962 TaxID=3364674 RepID=UPI0036782008